MSHSLTWSSKNIAGLPSDYQQIIIGDSGLTLAAGKQQVLFRFSFHLWTQRLPPSASVFSTTLWPRFCLP